MAKLTTIEGIGPAIEAKLNAAGISSVESLLKICCDRKGREQTSKACGIESGKLLRFANHADLMRISGIGGQYSELLEAAGVDSTTELKARNSENLAKKMQEVNSAGAKRLVRQVPSVKQIDAWIRQAKSLSKVITH